VKLVHIVGFVAKKFVTMYGYMNVKYVNVHPLLVMDKWANHCLAARPLQ